MGNGEREDENRKLAEWLGYVPHAPSEATNKPYLLWRSPVPPYDYLDHLPDFRTDETANAMLLDRLRSECQAHMAGRPEDTPYKKPFINLIDALLYGNEDRKTLVVLAALALLNERGRG